MSKKEGPAPTGKGSKKGADLDDFRGSTLTPKSDTDKEKGK